MGRGRGKPKLEIVSPPPEQMAGSEFVIQDVTDKRNGGGTITIGKAYRRRPMIEQLHDRGLFSQAEFKALKHYRHYADIAERSPVRDSLNRQHGGNGTGPGVEYLNAVRIRSDVERAVGSLIDILRAVVVEDQSLSQFAIRRAGAIEECKETGSGRICRLKPRRKALEIAQLEITIAAQRVQAELDA